MFSEIGRNPRERHGFKVSPGEGMFVMAVFIAAGLKGNESHSAAEAVPFWLFAALGLVLSKRLLIHDLGKSRERGDTFQPLWILWGALMACGVAIVACYLLVKFRPMLGNIASFLELMVAFGPYIVGAWAAGFLSKGMTTVEASAGATLGFLVLMALSVTLGDPWQSGALEIYQDKPKVFYPFTLLVGAMVFPCTWMGAYLGENTPGHK